MRKHSRRRRRHEESCSSPALIAAIDRALALANQERPPWVVNKLKTVRALALIPRGVRGTSGAAAIPL